MSEIELPCTLKTPHVANNICTSRGKCRVELGVVLRHLVDGLEVPEARQQLPRVLPRDPQQVVGGPPHLLIVHLAVLRGQEHDDVHAATLRECFDIFVPVDGVVEQLGEGPERLQDASRGFPEVVAHQQDTHEVPHKELGDKRLVDHRLVQVADQLYCSHHHLLATIPPKQTRQLPHHLLLRHCDAVHVGPRFVAFRQRRQQPDDVRHQLVSSFACDVIIEQLAAERGELAVLQQIEPFVDRFAERLGAERGKEA